MEPILVKQRKGSAGGKARAISSRREALERYYNNPSVCKECGRIIEVEEGQVIAAVRVKKFCNQRCSALYNNKRRERKVKERIRKLRTPKFEYLKFITKGELFERSKGWNSAAGIIRKHARHVYNSSNRVPYCENCGYNKHYEVCHIKAVSDFDLESKIVEINDPNNLVGLCPNCHWELDHIAGWTGVWSQQGLISPIP